MINQTELEAKLHLHGLTLTAPEDSLRPILEMELYSADEIEEILDIRRLGRPKSKEYSSGLYKLYRSDAHLQAGEVSALLGVDVQIGILPKTKEDRGFITEWYGFVILFFTLVLTAGIMTMVMFQHKVGIFDASTVSTVFD